MIHLLAGSESVVLSTQQAQLLTLERDKRILQCATPNCSQREIPSQMFGLSEPPIGTNHRIHVICAQHYTVAQIVKDIPKEHLAPLLDAISAALRAERAG